MATLRSGKQVGGSDGGGGGSGGEVDSRDRGAVQAADIKEKRNAWTSKVVFGSLILDLLGFKVVLPLFPALLDYYSKHDSSGLYSSVLSCVTYYQHIISVFARFHSVLFGGYALISVAFSIGFTIGLTVGAVAVFSHWGSTGWFAASAVYALTLAVANIIFFAVFFQELLPEDGAGCQLEPRVTPHLHML